MKPITTFSAQLAPLPINDIDTDQIIPARFLKTIDKQGLGQQAFYDWRYQADGTPNADFVLNQPAYNQAQIIVAGHNFGCGSSREHAPWALIGMGMKAIISTEFADIFRNNALKNGLLPITVDDETHQQLISLAQEDPQTQITIDLAQQSLQLPDGRKVHFPIDAFSKECLLKGIDQLGYLLNLEASISEYETSHPQCVNTQNA